MNKILVLFELKMISFGLKRFLFFWEEICMYLYGYVLVEFVIFDDWCKFMKYEEFSLGMFLLVSN